MLVPVLVGMDFIRGNGLVMDFKDGFAVCAAFSDSKPFYMSQNAKQHYMVDIVDFLCCGQSSQEGHPTIHVIESEDPQQKIPSKRVQWFDSYSQLPKSWRNPKNLEISLGEGFCGSRGDVAFSLCLG